MVAFEVATTLLELPLLLYTNMTLCYKVVLVRKKGLYYYNIFLKYTFNVSTDQTIIIG